MSTTTPPDNQTSVTSTICLNCTFAEYEDNTQIGCKAGRLQLFEKANVEIKDTEKKVNKIYLYLLNH